ncbi:MAG TPA: LptF/LptG family permease [Terriglobales bacterium]|nr:LptF/LptG family permease [Terriglobales bacterium]
MRILTRYILREVLAHAALGAALFTFVLFMRDVGRILELVVRNSAPLSSVFEIFLLILPSTLTFTIPMGVLVGILIGLGRLAADSEVTAMRASGIGATAFILIVAIFAVSAWLLALLNTVVVAPRASAALAELEDRLKSSEAAYAVQPRVFYENIANHVLYVQDARAGEAAVWRGIFLADVSTPSSPKITLAEQGTAVTDGTERIRLHLRNGAQHETDPRRPKEYSITNFSVSDLPLLLPQRTAQPRENRLLAQMGTLELLQRGQQLNDRRGRAQEIEFYRRLALPTACLVLAMVGIPLGLAAHKGGKSTGFVLTIALVFLYYVVSLFGISLARQGKLPPALGAWLANLVFFAGGAILLWRVDHQPLERFWRSLVHRFRHKPPAAEAKVPTAPDRLAGRRRVFDLDFPQLLDTYVLRDFFAYFLLVLAGFLVLGVVFTFFEMWGDVLRNRVPVVTVAEFVVNFVPSLVYQMTPLAVLIAVLVTFALLERNSEIVAIKATGISIYRVAMPVLILAGVFSAGLFFFDHFYLPEANTRQDALWNQIKGKPAQTYLRPDRKWIFGQHSSIYYYEFFDPDRFQMGGVSVFLFDPSTFEITRRVYAARAEWDPKLAKWLFKQGWTRAFRGTAIEEYRTFDVATFEALDEPPTYFRKEVKQSSEMDFRELSAYIRDLEQSGFDAVRLRVQWHKKFAFPAITLVMAVLAVPFALSVGRRGALGGVAMALGIAVVYWATSGLLEAVGNVSQLPPFLAAWSPDLLFALVGGYLILRLPT